jgi:hypothetical protein
MYRYYFKLRSVIYISLYMAFKFLLLSNCVNELHDYWDEYGKAPAMTLHGGKNCKRLFL